MSKLLIKFHAQSIRTLPAIRTADGEIPHTVLRPGENIVEDSVIAAWHKHREIKPLLFKGSVGAGIEIVAEDGKPVAHEDVLQALYGAELPPLAERLRAVAEEQAAAAAFVAKAAKPAADIQA